MNCLPDTYNFLEKFRLQFITNADTVESIVKSTCEILDGGCKWIQLRMKNATDSDILAAGKEISKQCRKHEAVFILDDKVDLVEKVGAEGVHLGKHDMPVDKARAILGRRKIIGATANTIDDIISATSLGADYIGLGPFRFTTTKQNLSPILGLEGYRTIIAECRKLGINIPVVAIGGITDGDISDIIHAGADGIAVSGALLNADSPAEAASRWLMTINNTLNNNI